jgi:hypothetical protein
MKLSSDFNPKKCSVFYILDSLRTDSRGLREGKQIQSVLLNHFDGQIFNEDRMAVKVPQVICQLFKNFR